MKVVLGIDAAWSAHHPSGVALVRSRGSRWECLAVAPSYASFGERVDWRARAAGAPPDCDALLATATKLAGAPPDVIAIDMPLATMPITRRRAADDAAARALARFKLGLHSPGPASATAELVRIGFARHGYTIATRAATPRALIEVFPHAAAIALTGATTRVPYKLSRTTQYWPTLDRAARRRALLARWASLRRGLARSIDGDHLPRVSTRTHLKSYEDALDALICAWIGTQYLAGRVRAHGDDTAAVWL